jgi:hypothetical protein
VIDVVKKFGLFLCLVYFIVFIPNIIYAAEIVDYPEETIELSTDIQDISNSFNVEQGVSIIGLGDVSSEDVKVDKRNSLIYIYPKNREK